MSVPIRAAITGVAMHHPEKVVTNADLEKQIDTTDEWIRTRTGIRERRYVKPGQGASDLAAPAVAALLKSTRTSPEDVDLILVATVTPDTMFPSTASRVQKRVKAVNAWGFDVSAACSSFLYALSAGEQFIRAGTHKKVVVAGADIMTAIFDPKDRNTSILFGDAAGAVLLEPEPEATELGILGSIHHMDGKGLDLLEMPAGGSLRPASHETVDKMMHVIRQEGREVFKHAVRGMADVTDEILDKYKISPEEIDLFVAHQANLRIIEATQKKLGLPDEKVMINIDKYANTTSATLPTCLAGAVEDGRLTKGKLVLLTAFGAGFTWGATLVRWAY